MVSQISEPSTVFSIEVVNVVETEALDAAMIHGNPLKQKFRVAT